MSQSSTPSVEAPQFRFVEDPHGYFLGDEELPSPSSVFQDLGLVDKRWFTRESRERGTAVHAGIHYALKGTLDWKTLHPDLHGYVKSGLRLVDRLKPKIVRLETSLYHPKLRFAGTSDAEWEIGTTSYIVDWKSGKAPKVARYQTAAYSLLAEDGRPRNWKRVAVELQADGSDAKVVYYNDYADFQGWLNLLGAYRIRRKMKGYELTDGQGEAHGN